MLALCREQRLEHRTKHIALRYFLARELLQRGQLRLAYVASEANTADVFTKALAPCDHQRCCTQLGLLCFALLDWSCDPLFSPTLPMGLNLWPRVSLPETSPTLRWTGEVGDASVFRVWGSRAFVRDTFADKLSPHAFPCVFLGFVLDAPSREFCHPTSRRVLPSQDVTLDESVPFYRLFPYRSTPPPPPPLFLAPGPPPVDPLPPQGPAPSGVSQVDPLPGPAPVQVAVGSDATRGVASGGAESGGAELGGAGSEGAEARGAEPGGVGTGGAEPQGAASSGGSARASPRLSPQQLREWFVRHARLRSGATGAGGARAGGAGVAAGASGARGAAATGPGGARTRGTGAAGTGGVEGAGVVGPGAGGAGAARAGQVLGTPSSTGLTPPLLCPPPDQSQPPLQPASPLPAPSPYTEQSSGLTERREPASCPVSPVRTARRAPESSLPTLPDPEFDRAYVVSPAVSRLLATAVTDPSFESATVSSLVAELLDFAAACRLDYATALVAESASASPPSVGGTYVDAVPPSRVNIVDGMWIFRGVDYFNNFSPTPNMTTLRVLLHVAAQRDYELHSLDFSTAFLQGSQHEEIWLRRPPGFTGTFPVGTHWSLRRPVYGLRQVPREWHNMLRTTLAALGFAPSTADLSLFLRTDTSLPLFYVLVYVNDLVFATANTEALTLVKSEPQKRHTCTDLGLQITWDRAGAPSH
ncbi:unnamed protein product [Closterium sp. NIES-53]